MEYLFSVGANAPPESNSSGFIESMASNLSLVKSTFLDVFTEELSKFTFDQSETLVNNETWKPDYFDSYYDVSNQYGDMSAQGSASSHQIQTSDYQVVTTPQENQYVVDSSQSNVSESSQDQSLTSSSINETVSNQQDTDVHQNSTTRSETKVEEDKSTHSEVSEKPKESESSAQDIATKYEDIKKAAMEAAQTAIGKMDAEKQAEILAKIYAMMAPEAAKNTSEMLSKVLEMAENQGDIDIEGIDLASLLNDEKAGDFFAKLEVFTNKVLVKENAADIDGKEENQKVSLLELFGKDLGKSKQDDGQSQSLLTKSMQKEVIETVKEVLAKQVTTENQQTSVTAAKAFQGNNPANVVEGDVKSQQQNSQMAETVNSVNAGQSKKGAAENVNQQNVVFVDKTAQASELSESFGLARSAEARESTPVFQVARNIEVMEKDGKSSMKVQLHPESLGKIELQLVSTDNGLSVILTPQLSTTVKLLEAQLNQLRTTLAEAGIELSDLNVNQQDQSQKENGKSNHSKRNGSDLLYAEMEMENESSQQLQLDMLSMMDYRV